MTAKTNGGARGGLSFLGGAESRRALAPEPCDDRRSGRAPKKLNLSAPRIALVCDWLTTVGGAEQVLKAIYELYPSAPIYTSKYDEKGIDWFKDADIRTGWLQIFPTCLRRFLSPLRQIYFSHLDLSEYDIIISVTGAEAKSIKKGQARHLCYCHVPTQYYWQFYEEYLKHPGFGILDPLARLGLKLFVKPLRKADFKAAKKPDQFITISSYAAEQIKKYYKRESIVIHPPVSVENFHNPVEKNDIKKGKSQASLSSNYITKSGKNQVRKTEQGPRFINFSRQVTWKRLDIIVKAIRNINAELTLIGDGPEHDNLVKLAAGANNIRFLKTMPQEKLKKYLDDSDAFLFPSIEPFGIAPVEALAAGCPVIALKKGGSLDFIEEGKNGLFFDEQTPDSLRTAIKKFEQLSFNPATVSKSVENFSTSRFKREITEVVNKYGR